MLKCAIFANFYDFENGWCYFNTIAIFLSDDPFITFYIYFPKNLVRSIAP